MTSGVPRSYIRLCLLLEPSLIKEEGLKCQVAPETETQKAPQFRLVLAPVTAAFWGFLKVWGFL